jgi:hypothetical protein
MARPRPLILLQIVLLGLIFSTMMGVLSYYGGGLDIFQNRTRSQPMGKSVRVSCRYRICSPHGARPQLRPSVWLASS